MTPQRRGVSAATVSRGGVILPIWQAEAMWLSFGNNGPDWGLDFPVAIKVAAGKINAMTGDPWRGGLQRDPQDYMVSPEQPWLDGFAVEKGVIRQFVAMPLGEGYSVEEQLTGDAEWGGLQISVIPLKVKVWKARRRAWEARQRRLQEVRASFSYCESVVASACLSSMRGQRIRLDAIDPPKSSQLCLDSAPKRYRSGQRPGFALADMVGRTVVSCESKDRDRYKRMIAVCFKNDVNLNA